MIKNTSLSSLAVALLLLPAFQPKAHSQEISPAVSTPGMQRQFAGLYAAWRDAMIKQDFDAWQQVTAQSRQGKIRNQIVSQRAKYPEALFESAIQAPDLSGLLHADTLMRENTATSVYFGKADFGVSDASMMRDNFIVLHFVREFGVWKYDNLRVVNFGEDTELLLKMRKNDMSFLEAPEFQPAPVAPVIPGPVNVPDYVSEIWVTAVGYRAKVVVNAQHTSEIANNRGRELINGGVSRGNNRISVEVEEIPVPPGTVRHLEIGIYGAANSTEKANRFYHFRSSEEAKPTSFQTTFAAP